MDQKKLVEQFKQRDKRALSRLLSGLAENDANAEEALEKLAADSGQAHVVGITGPPGVGKSTLVGCVASTLHVHGQTVGIICVDPSSKVSGGALLGDRLRLGKVANEEGIYVRSFASRGEAGGLVSSAWGAVLAMEAFGFDTVLVETVGSGQGEVDIGNLVDTLVLVTAPGLGDQVQFLKAGIMEVADIFVINMGDHAGSKDTLADLCGALSLRGLSEWVPPVLVTTAVTGEGVPELVKALWRHLEYLEKTGERRRRRRRRFEEHVRLIVWREIRRQIEERLQRLPDRGGESMPFSTARTVLGSLRESGWL
jgi:LAO/AO transport system kinase